MSDPLDIDNLIYVIEHCRPDGVESSNDYHARRRALVATWLDNIRVAPRSETGGDARTLAHSLMCGMMEGYPEDKPDLLDRITQLIEDHDAALLASQGQGVKCPSCGGTGSVAIGEPGYDAQACTMCDGTGKSHPQPAPGLREALIAYRHDGAVPMAQAILNHGSDEILQATRENWLKADDKLRAALAQSEGKALE